MKVYAGIGSRETPPDVLKQMESLAELLATNQWCLRSGGAPGADSAFEAGAIRTNGATEIFLPWRQFNGNQSQLYPPAPEAFNVAELIHPVFSRLNQASRALIARNMHQILGQQLNSPVDCVICWTSDGCETASTCSRKTGGTGSAIKLASYLNIPVFNLRNHSIEVVFGKIQEQLM